MSRLTMRRTHRLGMAAVMALETYNRRHLDRELYELISLRASQLNGCRYCIDLHTRALRDQGQNDARLAEVASALSPHHFSERELAALALTDAVTRLSEDGVDDPTWERARGFFTDAELGDLVLAIATINVWNRIAIATRMDS